VFDHGVDLVSSKEVGVKGAIHLTFILDYGEFLRILPHAGGREKHMENSLNLL